MALRLNALNIAQDKAPDQGGPLPHADLMAVVPDLTVFAGALLPPHSNGVRTGCGIDAATTRAGPAAHEARPGHAQLKAVKAGDVHAIDHSLVWSPRNVYGMQDIAKQLYPRAFADIEPANGLAEFHARFLPVPSGGARFARLGG